jgi:hypothetical protein
MVYNQWSGCEENEIRAHVELSMRLGFLDTMMLDRVASNIRFCGCSHVHSEPLKNARI